MNIIEIVGEETRKMTKKETFKYSEVISQIYFMSEGYNKNFIDIIFLFLCGKSLPELEAESKKEKK